MLRVSPQMMMLLLISMVLMVLECQRRNPPALFPGVPHGYAHSRALHDQLVVHVAALKWFLVNA